MKVNAAIDRSLASDMICAKYDFFKHKLDVCCGEKIDNQNTWYIVLMEKLLLA